MTDKQTRFRQTLDDHHEWPCPYTFKFIVPTENLHLLEALLPDKSYSLRESKSGKYTSVTMETTMCSGQEVMDTYEKVSSVPGIMTL